MKVWIIERMTGTWDGQDLWQGVRGKRFTDERRAEDALVELMDAFELKVKTGRFAACFAGRAHEFLRLRGFEE